MNTEITKLNDIEWLKGWVLYDGDCPFCSAWAVRFEKILTRRGFDLAPLQSCWVRDCLGLSIDEPPAEMQVLTVRGENLGGADAVLYLARLIWWAWPLYAISLLPGGRQLLRVAYRWLAGRRHCRSKVCALRSSLP